MDIRYSRLNRTVALVVGSCALALAADPPLVVNLVAQDLAKMPRTTVVAKDNTYEGVLISDLLKQAGMNLDAGMRGPLLTMCVVAEARDGYRTLFSLPELDPAFTTGRVIVADRVDGKPLSDHDGPLEIVVPDDKRPDRWVRGVERLRVTRIEAQTGRLSGTVVSETGHPLGALIELMPHGSNSAVRSVGGRNFEFEVEPGTYDVRVMSDWYSISRIGSIEIAGGQRLQLPAIMLRFLGVCAADAADNLYVTHSDSGTLSGLVVDDHQGPISNARVRLFRDHAAVTNMITDAQGQFTFARLEPGTYSVVVQHEGFYAEDGDDVRVYSTFGTSLRLAPERCPNQGCSPGLKTVKVLGGCE